MRPILILLLFCCGLAVAQNRGLRNPAFVANLFPPASGGGGSNCSAITNNPTTDTEVGTWTRDSGTAAYYTYVDDGRGVAGADFIYKFDDGSTDTDTLAFDQPDGSCDATNVAITVMAQSSAGTPGFAMRVSPDNATWTDWITNTCTTTTAERTHNWAVTWTAPNNVYVQFKTTTPDFNVVRLYSIQALINKLP